MLPRLDFLSPFLPLSSPKSRDFLRSAELRVFQRAPRAILAIQDLGRSTRHRGRPLCLWHVRVYFSKRHLVSTSSRKLQQPFIGGSRRRCCVGELSSVSDQQLSQDGARESVDRRDTIELSANLSILLSITRHHLTTAQRLSESLHIDSLPVQS